MKLVDHFLVAFGDITIAELTTFILAIFFLFAIYKEIKKPPLGGGINRTKRVFFRIATKKSHHHIVGGGFLWFFSRGVTRGGRVRRGGAGGGF
jgi:hypothetical protein